MFGNRGKRIIVILGLFIPLFLLLTAIGYFFHKFWRLSEIITVKNETPIEAPPLEKIDYVDPNLLIDESFLDQETKDQIKKKFDLFDYAKEKFIPERGTRERINILLLGKAVPGYPGSDLTDTIILASLNPQTYTCSLLSIPRDLYVKVPGTKTSTKINAIYVYGLKSGGHEKGMDLLKKTVTEVTGQKIDYYAMVNFSAFEQMVDLAGGVDVKVEEDIFDNRYPGPNFSYQVFEIKKGDHHLDGATALKYVRVRHNAGGDFGRARRQQQVLESLKIKFFKERNLRESLDFFDKSLKVVEKNVKTDIPFSDYFPFIFILKDLNPENIVNKVLDNSAEGLLESYNPVIGRTVAYTLRPRAGNYFEIRKLSQHIFGLEKIKKLEELRKKESASVAVVADPKLAGRVSQVEKSLRGEGYQTKSFASPPNPIKLWQRKENASLETGKRLPMESLLEKDEFDPYYLEEVVIYDNAEGKKPFSLDDLSRRLKGKVSLYKDPDFDTDFVVILGSEIGQIFDSQEDNFFLTEEGLEQEEKDF